METKRIIYLLLILVHSGCQLNKVLKFKKCSDELLHHQKGEVLHIFENGEFDFSSPIENGIYLNQKGTLDTISNKLILLQDAVSIKRILLKEEFVKGISKDSVVFIIEKNDRWCSFYSRLVINDSILINVGDTISKGNIKHFQLLSTYACSINISDKHSFNNDSTNFITILDIIDGEYFNSINCRKWHEIINSKNFNTNQKSSDTLIIQDNFTLRQGAIIYTSKHCRKYAE